MTFSQVASVRLHTQASATKLQALCTCAIKRRSERIANFENMHPQRQPTLVKGDYQFSDGAQP
ncbi:hypothetical protein KL86DES1_21206 [uncultured Desulfovibrio sp.]|uniref:Uncharacterized protein n=1 Tax=uncultured Desulfovibrio sp. TaxID=167968 RepID=A0A212L728_9BACT|nr:hypothetical protein KL86DES1_21206 [uncultured Desulfovibrio sp.]VZH34103.1 conserved protein of unknown function [Desulfovibrio sp. 86]